MSGFDSNDRMLIQLASLFEQIVCFDYSPIELFRKFEIAFPGFRQELYYNLSRIDAHNQVTYLKYAQSTLIFDIPESSQPPSQPDKAKIEALFKKHNTDWNRTFIREDKSSSLYQLIEYSPIDLMAYESEGGSKDEEADTATGTLNSYLFDHYLYKAYSLVQSEIESLTPASTTLQKEEKPDKIIRIPTKHNLKTITYLFRLLSEAGVFEPRQDADMHRLISSFIETSKTANKPASIQGISNYWYEDSPAVQAFDTKLIIQQLETLNAEIRKGKSFKEIKGK